MDGREKEVNANKQIGNVWKLKKLQSRFKNHVDLWDILQFLRFNMNQKIF